VGCERVVSHVQYALQLVFVDSKAGADMLAQAIEKQHRFLHARSFHAGKSQQERVQILEDFVDERVHVLVTTNVLGRGIDLLTVDLVVVFDAPKTTAEYVHIAGRVGRGVHGVADGGGSNLGASVMYVNARDAAIFPELVQIYRHHRLRIPEELYRSVRAKAPKTAPPVIVEEAKRAFHVLRELDHDDLASRASKWGRWKYSTKRPRYT
jgi:superfamily II DNA/RNA helicase